MLQALIFADGGKVYKPCVTLTAAMYVYVCNMARPHINVPIR